MIVRKVLPLVALFLFGGLLAGCDSNPEGPVAPSAPSGGADPSKAAIPNAGKVDKSSKKGHGNEPTAP